MSRIIAREHVFKMLFQTEFENHEHVDELVEVYLDECDEHNLQNLNATDQAFMLQEVHGTLEHKEVIDELIEGATKGWKIKRLSKVDLTILRLAVYEIRFDDTIPVSVSINEAVNLAKKYSSDSAPSFINGVLGNIVSQ